MTPDPAPNIRQLLTFYLEAGVDCALMEEPVNRLSDPDIVPAPREIPASRETPPPATFPASPAAIPAARGEPAPLPEAAIQSARAATHAKFRSSRGRQMGCRGSHAARGPPL